MGNTTRAVAEKRPVPVWLNLGDLERLLAALADSAGLQRGRRRQLPDHDTQSVARKIQRARDRRYRAAQRAGGS
jgi:hypothetical protein